MLPSDDSDDELDKYVPTILPNKNHITEPTKSISKKTKYKGVFTCGKKFKAQIQTNGVQHYLGLFDTELEAARAYDVHARQTLGSKAKTNFEYMGGDSVGVSSASVTSSMHHHAQHVQSGSRAGHGGGLGGNNGGNSSAMRGLEGTLPLGGGKNGMDGGGVVGMEQQQQYNARGQHHMKEGMDGGMEQVHGHGVQLMGGSGQQQLHHQQQHHQQHRRVYIGIKARRKLDMDMNSGLMGGGMHGAGMGSYGGGIGYGLGALHSEYVQHAFGAGSGGYANIGGVSGAAGMGSSSSGAGGGGLGGDRDDSDEPPMKMMRGAADDSTKETMAYLDWREQIYYWTGELSFDAANKRLKWRGSWLGSFVGRPEAEEFAWSNNEFEYVTMGKVDDAAVLFGTGSLAQLRPPPAAFFHGHYMMDANGTGKHDKYFDKQFFIEFQEMNNNGGGNSGSSSESTATAASDASPANGSAATNSSDATALAPSASSSSPATKYLVLGKGDSEFGPFLLSGTYNVTTRILDMSRQYIDPAKQNQQDQEQHNSEQGQGQGQGHHGSDEHAQLQNTAPQHEQLLHQQHQDHGISYEQQQQQQQQQDQHQGHQQQQYSHSVDERVHGGMHGHNDGEQDASNELSVSAAAVAMSLLNRATASGASDSNADSDHVQHGLGDGRSDGQPLHQEHYHSSRTPLEPEEHSVSESKGVGGTAL